MDPVSIDNAIFRSLISTVKSALHSGKRESVTPDMSEHDTPFCLINDEYVQGSCDAPEICRAFRMKLTGVLANLNVENDFVTSLTTEAKNTKREYRLDDIDGDGKDELLFEYQLSEKALKMLDGGLLCGRSDWGIVTHDYKPMAYVVKLSKGATVIIDVEADFIEAKSS